MKYRKKPVIVEAIKYTLDSSKDVFDFAKGKVRHDLLPRSTDLRIETLEGTMRVSIGDYIIKGVQGEFYPCKPDIFEQTYEEV